MTMRALAMALLMMLAGAAASYAANGYDVPVGATVTIDEHGECREVTNPAGQPASRFVSTRTAPEWQSFRDNPNGLVMAACVVNCTAPWGGTVAHGTGITAYQAASVPHGSGCGGEIRVCNNGILTGSYMHQACTVDPPPGGYLVPVMLANGLPTCAGTIGDRCSPITHYFPSGTSPAIWMIQTPTCQECGGDGCIGMVCNANPKILCAYFNSIGLLPDNIYAADLRYARQFVPDSVNRGYRLWAEPLTAYLKRNPDSILIPILHPLVNGWAEEMAYRMGEVDKPNWIGRVLIHIGTPIASALGWFANLTSGADNIGEQQ